MTASPFTQSPRANPGLAIAAARVTNPAGLRRWRVALGGSLFAPAVIHCIGDSLTYGIGAYEVPSYNLPDNAGVDPRSYPGQLRTLFARHLGTGEGGMITPWFQGTDSRVVKSNTTNVNSTGLMSLGVSITSTGPGTITYTLPPCTAFDILTYVNNINFVIGSYTYAVDGGAPVAVTPAAEIAYKVLRVTGLADTAHTVVITGTSTNLSQHFGVRPHYGKGVVVGRFGQPGWTVNDVIGLSAQSGAHNTSAIGNPAAQGRLQASLGAWGVNLVIIQLGHNDCTAQPVEGTTPTLYRQRLQSYADTAIAAGASVLLMSSGLPPAEAAPVGAGFGTFADYHQAARAIALGTDHCAHFDFSELLVSPPNAVALGLHNNSSSVHLTAAGYGLQARALFNILAADLPLSA